MKRILTINGQEREIEILSAGPEYRFRMEDGQERTAQVEMPEPGVYSVILDGRSYDASVSEGPGGGLLVSIDGYRFETAVQDPRKWSRQGAGQSGKGAQTLTSPMPGKIVRVLVGVGDEVEAGQGIVVVEAMKMQNEMKAGRAGKVLSLAVKEGATVTAGEVLATIG